MLCLAQSPAVDWSEGTSETMFCLAGHGVPVLARRVVAGCLATAAAIAATFAGFRAMFYPFDLLLTARLAVPPAVFVAGLAIFVGTVSRSYAAAVVGGFGIWVVDLVLPGQLTGPLYLFRVGRPLVRAEAAGDVLSTLSLPGLAEWAAGVAPWTNRWLLFGAGIGLIVLAALVYSRWIHCGRAL